jgi:hypothetical protein
MARDTMQSGKAVSLAWTAIRVRRVESKSTMAAMPTQFGIASAQISTVSRDSAASYKGN